VQKSLIATTRLRRLKNNAENVFGIIDPNQYWRTVTSGTVTITANADLDDIAKVQILTESPFFNDQAKILAEADVTAGQTVQLSYDAPRENSTLVAACVDSKGHHYIKPFDAGTSQISFAAMTANTPALTRALTRAAAGIDVSKLTLDADSTTWSINAARTIYANIVTTANETQSLKSITGKVDLWLNSNWENERIWQLSTNSSMSNGWSVVKIYIRNISQNGNEIRVPKLGEPPFALIVPGDFNYPIERVSIINAYTAFNTWANNANNYGRWLDSFVESKIYPNPSSR
jgi:hypothetical protein